PSVFFHQPATTGYYTLSLHDALPILGWLERHHKQPFFLYVDTWDPHEPWDPPAYYVEPYYKGYQGEVVNPNYWDYREDRITETQDRKSTRLNSSHVKISYAVFCLKKK